MFEIENINHIIMQCPAMEVQRSIMYDKLHDLDARRRTQLESEPAPVLTWFILGDVIHGLDEKVMLNFWITRIGNAIYQMYREVYSGEKQYEQ